MDIEDYRERQYQDYITTLVDEEEIELIECKCCGWSVEESEIQVMKMHDVNDGQELEYCKECIYIYKKENL